MKPPKFHAGQAVVCVKASRISDAPHIHTAAPKIGEICHIEQGKRYYGPLMKMHGLWIYRVGARYPWLSEDLFAPVEEMPAEAYAELLEALEPVTA